MTMVLSCLLLAFLPLAASPEAEGVSSRGVIGWLDACDRQIDSMHGFVSVRSCRSIGGLEFQRSKNG